MNVFPVYDVGHADSTEPTEIGTRKNGGDRCKIVTTGCDVKRPRMLYSREIDLDFISNFISLVIAAFFNVNIISILLHYIKKHNCTLNEIPAIRSTRDLISFIINSFSKRKRL